MTDNEFERLWQRAEAERYSERLAGEYGPWRRRQQRGLGMVAALAVSVAVALPLMTSRHMGYDHVYCNRSGVADSHWTGLASDMLLEA